MLAKVEQALTFRTLDKYRRTAFRIPDFDPKRDRFVIFSDAHIGDRRPRLDEFQHNEQLFTHALHHYLNTDFGLILNGDIEEGWKHRYHNILPAYESSVYAAERAFAQQGPRRHLRIWGNHDDDWKHPAKVRRYLGGVLKQPVQVHGSVLLGENILIAHGHQGDPNADKMARLSQRVVRYLWQPLQLLLGMEREAPVGFNLLWGSREHNLYAWARQRRHLLIAGHTHRASFEEFTMLDHIERIRQNLLLYLERLHQAEPRQLLTDALEKLDLLCEKLRSYDPPAPASPAQDSGKRRLAVPAYLNSGSCMSSDGVTCIEIDQGEVRLVGWQRSAQPDPTPRYQRVVHQQALLEQMLATL